MTLKQLKIHGLFFVVLRTSLISLPTSLGLSLFWNLGSMLGVLLVLQIASGLFLTLYYVPFGGEAFESVQYLIYEVSGGWFFRLIHINGASMIFFILYLHLFKALFLGSWRLSKVWFSGLLILVLIIAVAFIGYALVWSQISYWAVVVITSLVSVVPYFGGVLVSWIWGGFSVGSNTLKLFFSLHFLLPFLILFLILLHLYFLHSSGSTSILGYSGGLSKVFFYPYYWIKDLYNILLFLVFLSFVLFIPLLFGEVELFVDKDAIVSPVHIVPEAYFLSFYAVLRAIPNKALGVIIIGSILVELFFISVKSSGYYFPIPFLVYRSTVFSFITTLVLLSWLGQCLVEEPFIMLSQSFILYYFFYLFLLYYLGVVSIFYL